MRRVKPLFLPLILAFAALFLLVPACTLQAKSDEPRLDRSANFTQAAQTLDAQLTLAAAGAFPTATRLSTQVGTSIPVITPTSPGDPPAQQTSASGITCDRGMFIEDVSIPDGTNFTPGETFVKTWRIENSGSCTWTPEYAVVFDSGDAMSGPASFPLTSSSVAPGENVEISINLTAPQTPGNYRGDWKLRNAAGQTFGLGTQGIASFWVVINVVEKPALDINFDNAHICNDSNTAIFKVLNTGNALLDSVWITLTNRDSAQVIFGPFTSNGAFMDKASDCPPSGDSVAAGDTSYIAGTIGLNSAPGNTITAEFRFCTGEDLSGSCIDKTLEFKVP